MKISPNQDSDKKREASLNRFHGEAAAGAVENAGVAYQAPSIIAAGAEAQGVAYLSFFSNLILSLLCIKAPAVAAKIGHRKRAVFILALLNSLTWLPLVLILVFFNSVSPVLLVALWVLNLFPSIAYVPLRDSWLVGLVPSCKMGRYFGVRSAVSGIAYLGTFYLMGFMLDFVYTGQANKGFATIFAIAFAASLGSFIFYKVIQAPPATEQEENKSNFTDFLKEIKGGKLGTFFLFISLFSLSVSLCGPLFAVYMLKDLHFSYLTFTAVVSAEYLARIASASLWGKYADRVGTLRILGIVSRLIPFIPILWLFSSNVAYLIAVQLFAGTVWAGFDLCSQTFLYKAAPQEKRLKYIVYHKSLTTLATAVGALGGAYLLTYSMPVFGSQILGLFLLSGISRLLVVQVMFRKLVDLTFSFRPAKSPVDLDAALRTTDLRQGLFYYRQQNPLEALGGVLTSPSVITAPPKQGLLYRPEKWELFSKPESGAPANEAPNNPEGLLYKPQSWKQFIGEREGAAVIAKASTETVHVTKGLLYQPETWKQFNNEQLDSTGASAEVTPSRQGLFYQTANLKQLTRKPSSQISTEADTEITTSQGLLYRREVWKQFSSGQPDLTEASAEITASRRGLFYQTSGWKQLIKKLDSRSNLETGKEANQELETTKQGLLYRREDWKKHIGEPKPEASPKTCVQPAPSQGLFYRADKWGQYIKKLNSETSAMTPKQRVPRFPHIQAGAQAGVPNRRPVIRSSRPRPVAAVA